MTRRTNSFGGVVLFLLLSAAGVHAAAPADAPPAPAGVAIPSDATPESLFADFLHYATLGHFTAADAYARALLAHPKLDPVAIHDAAQLNKTSVDTLTTLIRKSSISDSAQKVLDLIQQGAMARRKDAEVIRVNIERLGGDPQQEWFAVQRLAESGEYAIPGMVQALLDPTKKALWPRVIMALPKIGRGAVNPLVIALAVRNDDVRLNLINALGELGYPQAIPYLARLAEDAESPQQTRDAAKAAITRIEALVGRVAAGSPEELYFRLGEEYFDELDAVRADPRLDLANVWYWDATNQALTRTEVPTRIFGQIMAMRCSEEALRLRNDHVESIALWLAANIRRESRLGMDVESGDPAGAGEKDPTRPAIFPRALYFTQAAGPLYANLVLERAIATRDSAVALGAIEALRLTAGEASMFAADDAEPPLAEALKFPDQVVRIRAALAIGAALPKSEFTGSPLVVPVLASALGQSGADQILVIDPDEVNRNRVIGALRAPGREVVGDASLYRGIELARVQMPACSGVFVAADITQPDLVTGLRELRNEFLFTKAPVVVLTKAGSGAAADAVSRADSYVELVGSDADDAALAAGLERVRARTRQTRLDPQTALAVAIQSAETLRRIAVDGRTVLPAGAAEAALIGALGSPSEELQTLAASVLALINSPTAQRAIGHVALDASYTKTLRLAAFSSLSESGKNHGLLLEPKQVGDLVKMSRDEEDLTLRTAASKALGALNIRDNQASDIIRSYYGG